jgi:hypothetical protein
MTRKTRIAVVLTFLWIIPAGVAASGELREAETFAQWLIGGWFVIWVTVFGTAWIARAKN